MKVPARATVGLFVLLAGSLCSAAPRDSRLDRLVSIDEIGTDLGRIAATLTKQTGIRFRVRRDIADEKIDVFVRNDRVGRVKNNIARLFHYRWTTVKGKDGATEYLLYRDANTRLAQKAARDAYTAWQTEHWTAGLKRVREILAMTDEDIGKLSADEYKWSAWIRMDKNRAWYAAYSALSDEELAHLFQDGRLFQPFAEGGAFDKSGFAVGAPGPVADGLQNSEGVEFSSSHRFLPYVRPGNDILWARVRGKFGAEASRGIAVSPSGVLGGDARPVPPAVLRAAMKGFGERDLRTLAEDPRLAKLVKAPPPVKGSIASDEVTFHTGLQRVANATGIPMFSDYFTTGEGKIPFYAQKAYNLVMLLCQHFGHQYASSEEALLFRHREWPIWMSREVPLNTLDALDRAGPKGEANFDQSLIAALLTREQLAYISVYGYSPRWIGSEWQIAFYQFLATLSKTELQSVTSGKGMRTAGLLPHRTAALETLMKARGSAVPDGGQITSVKVQREPLFDRRGNAFEESLHVTFGYSAPSVSTSEELYLLVAPRREWGKSPPVMTESSLQSRFYKQSPM